MGTGMLKRVLLAGLFHRANTFVPWRTSWRDFALRRGHEISAARGDGSPLSGVWQVADSEDWILVPVIDLRATPGGIADDDAVNLFWNTFHATAEQEIPLGIDGIFLVLHGAMVSESLRDVDGELIQRIRSLPDAKDIPICGVLDLHANTSQRMAELTQGLIGYRKNPHTDARATAVRAAQLLDRIMTTGTQPVTVWENVPILWSPAATGTGEDPMRSLQAMARQIEEEVPEILAVNVFAGSPFADTSDTAVSFTAVTFGDPDVAREQLRRLRQWAVEHRELGSTTAMPLDQVMPQVAEHVGRGETPVVLCEPADDIGNGAAGDGTAVLKALVACGIDDCVVVINDPDAVAKLRGAKIGERLTLSIGGKQDTRQTPGDGPVDLEVELHSRSDGQFDVEDRRSPLVALHGTHIDMGPCAVVQHRGVRVLLTSRRTPPYDLEQIRSQGIEPTTLSVIGVKAAVAHCRAYDRIAKAGYAVSTSGPCSADLTQLPYQHVRRPIFPLDEL